LVAAASTASAWHTILVTHPSQPAYCKGTPQVRKHADRCESLTWSLQSPIGSSWALEESSQHLLSLPERRGGLGARHNQPTIRRNRQTEISSAATSQVGITGFLDVLQIWPSCTHRVTPEVDPRRVLPTSTFSSVAISGSGISERTCDAKAGEIRAAKLTSPRHALADGHFALIT
jgi:hypothetical protein